MEPNIKRFAIEMKEAIRQKNVKEYQEKFFKKILKGRRKNGAYNT